MEANIGQVLFSLTTAVELRIGGLLVRQFTVQYKITENKRVARNQAKQTRNFNNMIP